MVRALLETVQKEPRLELLLMCEAYKDCAWQQAGIYSAQEMYEKQLYAAQPFACEQGLLHRIRVWALVNHGIITRTMDAVPATQPFDDDPHRDGSRDGRAVLNLPDRSRQRLLLQSGAIWNIWGRDDGLDEPEETPYEYFYDFESACQSSEN